MSDYPVSPLSPAAEKFILHWGEMGARWGVNRTVAQVQALLYLSPRPMPADEIGRVLLVARSNVSTSLRELQGWGIVRVAHVLGDRRDHFESLKDAWEILRIVAQERKRREIDPTVAAMRECVREAALAARSRPFEHRRLKEMFDLLSIISSLFDETAPAPITALKNVVKLRGKVITLLGQGKTEALG
jgi:DNA-binding transcriptional regulator GbsR (MarR family)